MSSIEKRGEVTTAEEKGLFDLAGAKQKIALVIELKKRDEDWQLSQELANPFLSAMVDGLLQWGDAEEKKQAAYVAKLLEWKKEAERFAEEKRRLGINQAFNNDQVKMWGEGLDEGLDEGLSTSNSSLPEGVRAVIEGNSSNLNKEPSSENGSRVEIARILAPELENDLLQLIEQSKSAKILEKENKYGNQSGEYLRDKDRVDRQSVMDKILVWAEALKTNGNAKDLSLTLRYKPLIIDLQITIAEENLNKIEDRDERKKFAQAIREVKNYVREFKLLPVEQTDNYFAQVGQRSEQQAKEKAPEKPKQEKPSFFSLFQRKNKQQELIR